MVTDMNFPLPEDRGDPTFKKMAPHGACMHCGMGKITQNGVPICPNCDTKSATKSGLVSIAHDPGVDEHGNIKEIRNKEVFIKSNMQNLAIAKPYEVKIDDISLAFKVIMESLDNIKISQLKSLSDVKKVTKLKKKIASLEIDIKETVGE